MSQIGTQVSDALFGMFLQDIRDIERRYPQSFRNRYYRYSYTKAEGNGFELVVDPVSLPRTVENEIRLSFDFRLNKGKKFRKTILVATDFSDASQNAARYAVEMAAALNARVLLFNAYQLTALTAAETVVFVNPQDVIRMVQEQLEREAVEVGAEYDVPIGICTEEGPAVEAIFDRARENGADLIVAGMKGAGKAIRRMFGSTVTALAGKTTIPLLVIPEGISYRRPRSITLANDNPAEATQTVLDTLRSVVMTSNPKIYVVRVVSKQEEPASVPAGSGISEAGEEPGEPFYEYSIGKNIPRTLAGFVSTHHTDILAIIPHRHSLLEKLLHSSITKRLIFQAEIPLLVLPEIRNKGAA